MGGLLRSSERVPASSGMTKYGVLHKENGANALFRVLNTFEAYLQSLKRVCIEPELRSVRFLVGVKTCFRVLVLLDLGER
jgi:hypothetical protein